MNGWHWTDEPNLENIIFEGHRLPTEAPLKVHFNYWFYVHLIYFNVTNTQGDLVLLRLKLLVINLPAVPSGGKMPLWRTSSLCKDSEPAGIYWTHRTEPESSLQQTGDTSEITEKSSQITALLQKSSHYSGYTTNTAFPPKPWLFDISATPLCCHGDVSYSRRLWRGRQLGEVATVLWCHRQDVVDGEFDVLKAPKVLWFFSGSICHRRQWHTVHYVFVASHCRDFPHQAMSGF